MLRQRCCNTAQVDTYNSRQVRKEHSKVPESNQPFVNRNLSTLQDTETQAGGFTPTASPEGNDPRKNNKLRNRLIIAASAAAIATVAAVGIGVATNAAPEKAPAETSAPAEPTAEPSAEAETPAGDRYEGGDFERTDPLPAELEAANEATPEQFAALPKEEQIKWATWAGQYKDQFLTMFSAVQGTTADAPYVLTAESDPKTLILDRSNQSRIATSFGMGTPTSMDTNGALDKTMAEKYMLAFTVIDEDAVTRIDNFVSTAGDSNGQAINVVQQARLDMYDTITDVNGAQDFSTITNLMNVDGVAVPCYRVSWTAPNGSYDFNIGAYSTVDYKNQPVVVTLVSE